MTETNTTPTQESGRNIKPVLPAVFPNIGCFVKLKGSRNKHQLIFDEDIVGNYSQNVVEVRETCSGEITTTTWKNLSEWVPKNGM